MSIAKQLPLGPIMVDIAGTFLTSHERSRLLHPLVGGVILFSRNYESPEQVTNLTEEIHALRNPPLLVAVDHEGGRVQRFREGFTRIPPMHELGQIWEAQHNVGLHLAKQVGWVLAAELRACGIDFSFAPVLDIDYKRCDVIGNRAFHYRGEIVTELAKSLILGLQQAGMASVGKHFPGHGYVKEDSHIAIPIDRRDLQEIEKNDLIPFKELADHGLSAVMPAHVIYPKVDHQPAGFSTIWLQEILRKQLHFNGVIFSDDLCMEGASQAGSIENRAKLALQAGCDMALVCNRPDQADELLSKLEWQISGLSLTRLARMHGQPHSLKNADLKHNPDYLKAVQEITSLTTERDFSLESTIGESSHYGKS